MLTQRSIFFLLAIFPLLHVDAQPRTLRGKVIDAKTLEPLPFASVFINFTTVGTNSDEHGQFELRGIPEGDPELICSYVGHENYQVKISRLGNADFVEIKLQPIVMKEVEVTSSRDDKWKSQLRKFESVFLGSGKNFKAEIINPWVLDFRESPDGVFTARASSPLEILNHSLGYRLIYVMKTFVYNEDAYNIYGDVRFEEIPTLDAALSKRWQSNRLKAFEGSSIHLFRSLINYSHEAEGFKVYVDQTAPAQIVRSPYFKDNLNSKLQNFETANKVIKDKNSPVYRLVMPNRIEVHYRKESGSRAVYRDISHAVSWIEVAGGIIEVNSQGIVLNPSKLVVSGNMGDARVAQLLPHDFNPDRTVAPPQPDKTEAAASALIEEPYLHTDKPYYYPQEVIWFKGYMNYADRAKMDTLSKVIYVELLTNDKVVQRNAYQIDNGVFRGHIAIPAHIEPGQYFVRAYTNWSRNFGDQYIFVKPVPILTANQSVAAQPVFSPRSKGISITFNKQTYASRDRIQLRIMATDSVGNPIYADLSVSVTDVGQVSPLPSERTILHSRDLAPSGRSAAAPIHKIEYGLSYTGEFVNSKGKPGQGDITIVEGDFDNVLNVAAGPDGKFALENIHFNDTVRIAVQGMGANKKVGTVKIAAAEPPPLKSFEKMSLDLVTGAGTQRYRTNVEDTTAQLLPEITVKSTRTEETRNVNPFKEKRYVSKHGTPDITVDGEWLRKFNSTNLLYALQSRVAGLRVIAYLDENGALHYTIKLGGPSNLSSAETTMPLVLINDIPLALDMHLVTEYLANLNTNEVERVEVLRYGKGAAYGTRGGNGVIAVYLRSSLDGLQVSGPRTRAFDTKSFQVFTLNGYAPVVDFAAPEYAVNQEAGADHRSTVYWDPMVTTDNQGVALLSFYAADLPGLYRVVVEGLSYTGEPLRGEALIRIE